MGTTRYGLMWSTIKTKHVDDVIKDLKLAFITGDKDELGEVLAKVEKETGYEIDFIYDIFVEQIEDEREDNYDIDAAIGAAAYNTLIPAYELDY